MGSETRQIERLHAGAPEKGMSVVAESVATSRAVAGKPTRQGKRAPVRIDKRFAIGRRFKELALTFRARLGLEADSDPLLLTAIERAATLQVLAEDAAARALRADPKVTLDDVVRLNRLAEIAVRRLRLDRNNATRPPSLPEYLRSRSVGGSAP
jgi:hypothetical protein